METNRQTKREAIFNVAYTLFLERGYENTKIIDIANAAGIGKGTVYEYFESKDALFAEMFESRLLKEYKAVEPVLSSTKSTYSKLIKFTEIEETTIERWNNIFSADAFQSIASSHHSKFHHIICELMGFRQNLIREILQHGMNSGELRCQNLDMTTIAFLGALNFYSMCQFHPKFNKKDKGVMPMLNIENWNNEDFIDIILNGLKNPSYQ